MNHQDNPPGTSVTRDTRQTFNITHVRSMSPRESSFGSFSQLGSFHQGGSTTQMPTALEDIIKLKKELRLRQAEFEKEKALLQQKNDQMQSQLSETQERLTAQATMYESMINSLKAHDSSSTTQMLASKLQASERQAYEEEILELKEYRRKLQEDLGNREHEYHKSMSDKDSQMKEIQLQVERLLLDKSQQLFAWEIERKELQQKYQMSVNDREQLETMAEMRFQNKVNEMQSEMDKMRLAQMIETEKIKSEYENSLKDLKLLHEQEKQNLEYRLDRQSHDLRSLHHMVVQQDQVTGDNAESTKQHRDMLSAEIGTIQAEVDKIKSQFDLTVQDLTKEKELAEARNEKLQKQLEKLKNAPKQPSSVRIDLPFRPSELVQGPDGESILGLQRQVKNLKEEVSLLQGDNEKLNEQVRKMRKEAAEMQEYAERLELNEKKLRQVLNDQSLIEQDQIVELRRQLNIEKKRVLEQSEIMSQIKEGLEKENHQQHATIIEKEKEIRALNMDLRNHEKKLYDIQSMFNTQLVGNSMNMSGMLGGMPGDHIHHRGASQQYNMLGGLNMGSVAYSQNNFSPQKFMGPGGQINQSLNLQPSFVGQMNQPMMFGEGQFGYQYQQMQMNDPHQMMLRSIQRMGDVLQMGQVECPHCFILIDPQEYSAHLSQNHANLNINMSLQGSNLPRSQSQSQLHSLGNLGGMTGNHLLSRQQAAQSVCVTTSKSHAALPLYKKGFAEDRQQEVVINQQQQANNNQPVMYLSQQPPAGVLGQQITRVPSFAQNNPVVQSSPRTIVGQRFAPNNRSFTCLLKEIDEEEEKNLVGSIPGGSRLNRDFGNTNNRMAELMETSEDGLIPRQSCINSARAEDRKSRNLHQGSNLMQATKDGAGSTVNYGMTTGQTNTSLLKQEIRRPSTSSEVSQNQNVVRPYTHDPMVGTSRESLKSATRKSIDKSSTTSKPNKISNEIKDLLEKLVTYQGGDQQNQQVDTKFSQHSIHSVGNMENPKQSIVYDPNSSNKQDDHLEGNNHLSTESLVELRSSDESSSLYVFGGNMKTYDFRPHATAREMFKKEILKPSLGSGAEGPSGVPVSSSVNNVFVNRKSNPAKHQKPPQINQKDKSKSKTRGAAAPQAFNHGPSKPMLISSGSSALSQPKLSSLEQPCLSRESSSPPHNGGKLSGGDSSSAERPPSVDRETARHTSKDTIMTSNMHQQKHKKGRRYHEVNQSNILTPNSPRRYQEYFKNKNAETQGYTGSLKSIPQNNNNQGLTSAAKGGLRQNKGGKPAGMNTNVHHYQQNHRYSPSITQSVVNESNYQHISPEKPKVNKNTFVLDRGLPMQNQLQNVIDHTQQQQHKASHPKQFYGNYDSGSVLLGGGPNSEYVPASKMLGFTPGGAGFMLGAPGMHTNFIDNSMDDDGEIRPSQIDEFAEKKENKNKTSGGGISALVGITSSYISIGEDDPFLAGKFNDATTQQFNFKLDTATASSKFQQQYMK